MSDVTMELAMESNDKAMEIARLKADNAKLREQIHWLKQGDILHVLTDQEYIDQCERERLMQVSIDALDKENAKLRELCADMLHDAMENICSKAYWCDEKSWQTCNDEKCGNRLYVEMARELGVDE